MKFSWSSLFGTNGYREIHNRAKAGDTAWVKRYLERGGDPNIKAVGDITPLYLVAKAGYFDIVKLLVEHGADVNQKLDEVYSPDFTPVLVAAYEGHDNIVEFLLKNGAEKDIYIAAILGDLDILKKYIKEEGNVHIIRPKGTGKPYFLGKTLLHLATWRDSLDVVKFLIESNANIHARDERGLIPLHNAASFDSQKSAKFLIEIGSDINALDREKKTPLHKAVGLGRAEMVKFLIACGADIDAQDSHDATPLHRACHSRTWANAQNYIKVVEILIANGANKNLRNGAGLTPLMLAKFCESSPEIINLLEK
ncbi:MAG: ankyrin repeat domain-containing protein [Cyanobacteria bacterium SBLK]|nr:ankyrin repeat domain-containing protein [Cyanobacteria bacterium SBLK]